jgi:hypothetical protein
MKSSLKYAIAFAALIFIIAHVGFYKKYIALFPTFEQVSLVTHFHATLLFSWVALILVQPILILNNKITLHKFLGKLSYVIAPLLVFSLFLITNQGYFSKLKRMTETEALASLSVNVPDFFAFGILYILGIYYRKKTDLHARYMIATTFPIIGAAGVRILMRNFGVTSAVAFEAVPLITNVMCVLFILSDWKSKKYKPYLITLMILLIEYAIWQGRYTDIWQSFAKFYVEKFITS